MKLLSIIIPVYNVEKYLYTCLNSISCQTDSEFEVLLVDDGSSDQSGLLCDEFEKRDGRFKAIHIKNSGPSIARNTGLKHANGDLITFVDSDDWVPLNYVETIRKIYRKMHVINYIPSYFGGSRNLPIQFVIEDPVFKDSKQSYFVQLADITAYFTMQHLCPNKFVKRQGAKKYFERLEPVMIKQASPTDPFGRVWIKK